MQLRFNLDTRTGIQVTLFEGCWFLSRSLERNAAFFAVSASRCLLIFAPNFGRTHKPAHSMAFTCRSSYPTLQLQPVRVHRHSCYHTLPFPTVDSSQSIMAAPCGSPSKDGLSPTVSQASAGAPTDSPDPAIDPQSNAKLILVLGSSGSGLSSFINRVAGNNKLAIRDPYLYSTCTTEVQGQTIEFNGRTYRMIDTPGFEGTMPDSEVLKRMSVMLEHT
jgi:hypothetical protein